MGRKEVLVTHLRQVMLEELQRRNFAKIIYLSQRHLQAVANPLDAMPVSGTDTVRRTRRLQKR